MTRGLPRCTTGPGGLRVAGGRASAAARSGAGLRGLAQGVRQACRSFEGHIGADVIRPADQQGGAYTVVVRFETRGQLEAWLQSPVRADAARQLAPLLTADETLRRMRDARARLIAWVNGLTPEQLERTGLHPAFGPMTIPRWLEFFLLHEAHHLYTAMLCVAEARRRQGEVKA